MKLTLDATTITKEADAASTPSTLNWPANPLQEKQRVKLWGLLAFYTAAAASEKSDPAFRKDAARVLGELDGYRRAWTVATGRDFVDGRWMHHRMPDADPVAVDRMHVAMGATHVRNLRSWEATEGVQRAIKIRAKVYALRDAKAAQAAAQAAQEQRERLEKWEMEQERKREEDRARRARYNERVR